MVDDTTTDDTQDQRDADTTTDDSPDSLGDAGKAALKAERDARKAADKTARDLQKELDAIKAERAKADENEAKEQGKWRELAEKREADLTDATTERDGLLARVETLEALANDRLAAILKDIPKDIAELAPDAETPIEKRLVWAEKAAKATKSATTNPGNGPNPKPAGNTKPDVRGALPRRQYIN